MDQRRTKCSGLLLGLRHQSAGSRGPGNAGPAMGCRMGVPGGWANHLNYEGRNCCMADGHTRYTRSHAWCGTVCGRGPNCDGSCRRSLRPAAGCPPSK